MTDDPGSTGSANSPARRPTPRAWAANPPDLPPQVPPPTASLAPPQVPPQTTAPGLSPDQLPGAGEQYRSSVVAVLQIVLGVASGALIAVILTALNADLWPVAVLIFLVAAATGFYLAPVSVSVENARVTIGQGRRERDPLVIYVAEIRDAGLRDVTWAQCLGFGGTESDDRTTRLAVRPGTTLVLTLHDGSRVIVSVTDGPAALRAIEAAAPA